MKEFTSNDVEVFGGNYHRIFCGTDDLVHDPLPWQSRGLQETKSGYGSKLTTERKIRFEGKDYRIYCTIYGNAGSCWFKSKGRKIFVG